MSATVRNGTATARPTSSADGIAWNLGDLYQAPDDPALERDQAAALQRARAFEARFRGRILVPEGPAPEILGDALDELEGLAEQMDRPAIYASLLHASKTDEPRHGALLMRTREQRTAINRHLIFFDLEWIKVDDGPARALLGHPRLARYRHFLEQKRASRPHYLSEPEE